MARDVPGDAQGGGGAGRSGVRPPATKFVLAFRDRRIQLRIGQFRIGRSLDVELMFDSALVSRRHAVLQVTDESVVIHDLESINGVFVNDRRILGSEEVHPGDKLRIGDQEMQISIARGFRDTSGRITNRERLSTEGVETLVELIGKREEERKRAGVQIVPEADPSPPSDAPMDPARASQAARERARGPTMPPQPMTRPAMPAVRPRVVTPSTAPPRDDPFEQQKQLPEAEAAQEALERGDSETAERILIPMLARIRGQVADGTKVAPELAERAALSAIQLGIATNKPAWVDFPVKIYARLRKPMAPTVVQLLRRAITVVPSFSTEAFCDYTAMLQAARGELDRSERDSLEPMLRLANELSSLR